MPLSVEELFSAGSLESKFLRATLQRSTVWNDWSAGAATKVLFLYGELESSSRERSIEGSRLCALLFCTLCSRVARSRRSSSFLILFRMSVISSFLKPRSRFLFSAPRSYSDRNLAFYLTTGTSYSTVSRLATNVFFSPFDSR